MSEFVRWWHYTRAGLMLVMLGACAALDAQRQKVVRPEDAVQLEVENATHGDVMLIVSANGTDGRLHQIGAHIHPEKTVRRYAWRVPADLSCKVCNDALVIEVFPANMRLATKGRLHHRVLGSAVAWRNYPNNRLKIDYDAQTDKHVVTSVTQATGAASAKRLSACTVRSGRRGARRRC